MKPFIIWFQKLIRQWVKLATLSPIIGVLSDLTHSRTDLVLENALLRQKLIVLNRKVKRCQFTNHDRFILILFACWTRFWKQALHIVQPDKLLRWHREQFRLYWQRKSKSKQNIPRFHLRPSRSSGRWPRKIAYGEQSGSRLNSSSWGSGCINGPFRNTC